MHMYRSTHTEHYRTYFILVRSKVKVTEVKNLDEGRNLESKKVKEKVKIADSV